MSNVIDATSPTQFDPHTSVSHVWTDAADIELRFELSSVYYIEQMHFWNYTEEEYDVDEVTASFYNAADELVKEVIFNPQLGFEGILAEDIVINATDVSYVHVLLSGSNNKAEFQNIGFSGIAVE